MKEYTTRFGLFYRWLEYNAVLRLAATVSVNIKTKILFMFFSQNESI